jgi:hypothetical protein
LTFAPTYRKTQNPKAERPAIAIEHEEKKTSVDNSPRSTRGGHNNNIAKRNGKITVPNSPYSLLNRISLLRSMD